MGCLNVNIRDEGQHLNVGVKMVNQLLAVDSRLLNAPLNVSCSLICDINSEFYLYVEPDVIWLTPDMVSEEFDIYSNVVWKIDVKDVEPEVPTVVLYLTNGTMITNDTLIRNEDVTRISLLKNDTLVQNK